MDEIEARMRAMWSKDPPNVDKYPGPFAFKSHYCKDDEIEPPSGLVETWVCDFLNRDGTLAHQSLKGLGLVPCLHRTMANLPQTTQVAVTDTKPNTAERHSAKLELESDIDTDNPDTPVTKPLVPSANGEATKGLSDCTNVGGTHSNSNSGSTQL